MRSRQTSIVALALFLLATAGSLFVSVLRDASADVGCSVAGSTMCPIALSTSVAGVLGVANGGTGHAALKQTVTASSHAFTCDFSVAKRCVVFLQGGGADVATFTGAVEGETYQVRVIQPAGGGGTVTWPANVYWPGSGSGPNTPPALTSTASTSDIIAFLYNGVAFSGEYGLNYAAAASTQ